MGSGASKGGSYKLTYFNGRGRGEVSRLCLAAAGVKFTDNRIEQADWPAYKSKTPLGFLPVLELNGKELTQQLVVNRFLAERFGLMGSNPMEKAKIDEVMTTACDFAVDCAGPLFASDKAAAIKSVLENKAPTALEYLKKTAENNPTKSGYLVGAKMSVADIAAYNAFEALAGLSETELNKYEVLKTCRDKVAANPNIAKYLKDRPVTPF